MTEITDLVDAVDKLTVVVTELSNESNTQQAWLERIERVATDARHNRIGIRLASAGIVLNLVLTGFGGWLFARVDNNTHEVQIVQQRTSSEILCPLYQVFAQTIKANPTPPNLTPDQVRLRREAGDIIVNGLQTLGCR